MTLQLKSIFSSPYRIPQYAVTTVAGRKEKNFSYPPLSFQISLELCDGGSITDIYQDLETQLDEAAIKLVIKGALEGLVWLHSQNVIHRDIKGANILLTAAGNVKLSITSSDLSRFRCLCAPFKA